MKFHVIPRERSDRGNPFSCDAKHRAAFSGRGNGLRLAKSRPTGGCSLARACGRSLRLPLVAQNDTCKGEAYPRNR